MEPYEIRESARADVKWLRLGAFYLVRGVAFLYRLNSLRLANVLFHDLNSATVIRRRFFGKNLVLDVSRANPQKLLWLQGERFVQERSLLKNAIRSGMTVIDVGANIGYYALMFSSFILDNGRIICFEPDPTNLRELRANVAANKLEGLVTIVPSAVGDLDGMIRFEPGLNSHIVADGSREVAITKIDSLALDKLGFMKIDVEGYEGAVLDGACKTIEQFHPTLFVELHPQLLTKHTHREIVQFLQFHYPKVTAYQMEPRNACARAMQSYGLAKQFDLVKDISRMAQEYEAGCYLEPCWLLAQEG